MKHLPLQFLLTSGQRLENILGQQALDLIIPSQSTKPDSSASPLKSLSWESWLTSTFRSYFTDSNGELIPFAKQHRELWEWVWAIETGVRPDPFIAIWGRGGGKSTSAEFACVAVGGRRTRRYGIYLSATQEQADDHVQNVGSALENSDIDTIDPLMATRLVGKYGQSKGWRRNRLRTMAGFTIDAMGLDSASRGAKIDDDRPDFLVLDDIDQDNDTVAKIQKKIGLLTRKIIPSGTSDLAILGVQNLVHANSIFARMIDGRADFLVDRKVSGPFPVLVDLKYKVNDDRVTITHGEPTWAGQTVEDCQKLLNDIGLKAFLAECQHDKAAQQGSFFGDIWVESIHVIEPFDIPSTWYIDRSFDYGWTKPFSVGWWAESDGSRAPNGRHYPKGTVFRIAEWYGWNNKPDQGIQMESPLIAEGILQIEQRLGLAGRVYPGAADASIWEGTEGTSIASKMAAKGVWWYPSSKGPGSRVASALQFKEYLKASKQYPMDSPGLFVFAGKCQQFVRTIAILPVDPTNPDDANTQSEDHIFDDTRYRLFTPRQQVTWGTTVGLY